MSTTRGVALVLAALISGSVLTGCSSSSGSGTAAASTPTSAASEIVTLPDLATASTGPATPTPAATTVAPAALPSPGNPAGHAAIPSAAQAVDTSHPTRVIGDGTPASCTSAAVVRRSRPGASSPSPAAPTRS
jgi:hypothetical protein